MDNKITRRYPEGMPEPVGNYTHITKIPRNAELYMTSGKIGMGPTGELPVGYITELDWPKIKVEIEIWAAKV